MPPASLGRLAAEMAAATSPTASIAHPAFPQRLRDTLDKAYTSLVVTRQQAVDLVEASIVCLVRIVSY